MAIQALLEGIVGGGGDGVPAILLKEVTFAKSLGGIPAGTVFPIGTLHDTILEKLAKAPMVAPTYTAPTLTLASTGITATPEVGSRITPTFTPTWGKNDAGDPTNYVLKKGGSNIYSNASPLAYPEPQFTVTEATVLYQATVTYAAGNIKNDSDGNPHPLGSIGAGSVSSNTISLTGSRYGFYGSDAIAAASTTSAAIRSLTGKVPAIANGSTFTIVAGAGDRRITFWYPNTLRNVSKVEYVEQGNADYTDMFNLSSVLVEGANSYTGILYKGYTWIPAAVIGSTMTFKVTL